MLDRSPLHLCDLGEEREAFAIERWMFGHTEQTMTALGLPVGWWRGCFLRRRDIFGDDADGDVDLIAGPLVYENMTSAEWTARVDAERAKVGDDFAVAYAHAKAGDEGRVEWPPTVEEVIACEVKASYFDGEQDEWKRTHAGRQARTLGQLDYLRDKGVNRISLLHLASTRPPRHTAETWQAAIDEAERAWPRFPLLVDPAHLKGYGYHRAFLSAIPEGTEGSAGVHYGISTIASPALVNAVEPRAWHETLRARLAKMPRPKYVRTSVSTCWNCGSWQHSSSFARYAPLCSECGARGDQAPIASSASGLRAPSVGGA